MRLKNIAKNFVAGMAMQIIIEILRFVVRTVFIYTLTQAYLGINGLFSSILNILNISELGIGAAIVAEMYKPLANNDTEKLKSLMVFYRKAYLCIGWAFLGIGLALMPFLPSLMKETTELVNIYFVYLLLLLNSVVSYWFSSYKLSIVTASQKNYALIPLQSIIHVGGALAQILALLLLRTTPTLSFYVYSILGIATTITINLLSARKAVKMFPLLKEKKAIPLSKEERHHIGKNVYALSVSKVSSAALNSIDNIVIASVFVSGVSVVGVYSNYTMITTFVTSFMTILANALIPSLGELCAGESITKKEETFNNLQIFYFWLFGFCSICLWILLNPFIGGIWLNTEWLLSDNCVDLIALNFLCGGLMSTVFRFVAVEGLFWHNRFSYIISAVLNIILSFALAKPLGMEGILLATVISTVVSCSIGPHIVYKYIFHKSAVNCYIKYFGNILIVIATALIVKAADVWLPQYALWAFVVRVLLCLIVPNGLWLLIFGRTAEFKSLKGSALTLWKSFTNKRAGHKAG